MTPEYVLHPSAQSSFLFSLRSSSSVDPPCCLLKSVWLLAGISHWLSAATANTLADTALRSVGRLDVLSKYASGGLGRAPCLRGGSAVSRRQRVRKAG